LLFDEADALFGSRTEVRDSHDRYANLEINYLLQRMEDYTGLAILATNRRAALDNAFLRRLRFIVEFPFPRPDDRRSIWERVFPQAASLADVDPGALSRLEITGANIRSIAVNAAFLAAHDGSPITMRHLMRSAAREYAKLSRPVSSAEFGEWLAVIQR
jgi:SpoVK/Ycf46/Vps4 family AAA+-type ATPase